MKKIMKQLSRLFFVLFLAALILADYAVAQTRGNNDTSQDKFKIIDAHTHGWNNNQWRKSGVVGGVVMPSNRSRGTAYSNKNIISCLGLIYPINIDNIKRDLDNNDYGCIKIFLGYIPGENLLPLYPSDLQYKDVYKLAKARNIPVVFHTGDPQAKNGLIKYADPIHIDEVAVANRGVNFIIAHCGNPWFQTAAEIAYKNKNVFLECSALMTGNIAKDSPPYGPLVYKNPEQVNLLVTEPIKWIFNYIENPRKIMFGSDFSVVSEIEPYIKAYKEAIPPKHWNNVFYKNAVCLYKFNERSTEFNDVKCKDFWDEVNEEPGSSTFD